MFRLLSLMTIFICSSAVAASQADHLDRAIPFVDIRAQRACSAARGLTLIVKITPISVRPGITDALITMSNEGGTGCFGRMGQQQILMVRTSGQKWIKMLDVKSDAVTPDPSELHAGFYDVSLSLHGRCRPVWRAAEQAYRLLRRCPDGPSRGDAQMQVKIKDVSGSVSTHDGSK